MFKLENFEIKIFILNFKYWFSKFDVIGIKCYVLINIEFTILSVLWIQQYLQTSVQSMFCRLMYFIYRIHIFDYCFNMNFIFLIFIFNLYIFSYPHPCIFIAFNNNRVFLQFLNVKSCALRLTEASYFISIKGICQFVFNFKI